MDPLPAPHCDDVAVRWFKANIEIGRTRIDTGFGNHPAGASLCLGKEDRALVGHSDLNACHATRISTVDDADRACEQFPPRGPLRNPGDIVPGRIRCRYVTSTLQAATADLVARRLGACGAGSLLLRDAM